jgi:hypothetical protein
VREKVKKQKEREKERKGVSKNGGAFSWLEKPQSYMNA